MTNTLADRLEQAEKPCRDLDAEIAVAANFCQLRGNTLYKWCEGGSTNEQYRPPHFTSSLDAAMTLVPEGDDWLRKDFRTMSVVRFVDDLKMWGEHIDGTGTTPALALSAAAIRARGK